MTKTRTDLVHRALKNLGVLPQGVNPSAEEYTSVNDLIDPMVEELSAKDIYYLQDANAIPDEAFSPLGNILASACRAEFGMAKDAAIVSLGLKGEVDLQKIQSLRPTFAIQNAVYY